MNKVLEPFVKDVAVLVSGHYVNYANNNEIMILLLQEKGYKFGIQGLPEEMFGTLVGVLADNPASCSIGGFKESCSANLPCRQCKILRTDISQKVKDSGYCATILNCTSIRSTRASAFCGLLKTMTSVSLEWKTL